MDPPPPVIIKILNSQHFPKPLVVKCGRVKMSIISRSLLYIDRSSSYFWIYVKETEISPLTHNFSSPFQWTSKFLYKKN